MINGANRAGKMVYARVIAPVDSYNEKQQEALGLTDFENPMVDLQRETLQVERKRFRMMSINMNEEGVIGMFGCYDRETEEFLGALFRKVEEGIVNIYNENGEVVLSYESNNPASV